jgi:hypothetical protein
LKLTVPKHAGELKAGSTFNLVTTLRNTGASEAKDIEVEIEGLGVESFLPNYTTKTVKVGNLKQSKKIDAKSSVDCFERSKRRTKNSYS